MSATAADKEKTPADGSAASQQTPEVKPFAPVEMDRGESAPVLYRNTTVEPDDFSGDNVFQIAISSEYPGMQRATALHESLGIAKEGELFTEVLSHEPGDVDLSWLNSGRAAFLDEHKSTRHLGKIHKANLAQDKVVRGVVECDLASKLSTTRRNQIKKRSRTNISCGYVHTRYLGPTKLADGTTGHRFAFQPREASSVADPLDPTVGLERKAEECACFGCGKKEVRTKMKAGEDGALYCSQDCIDAEESDESLRSNGEKMFRAKAGGKEFRISHAELRQKTVSALDNDKRFKYKRDNGDQVSDFYHHDNHQVSADATAFQAIVSSPAWRDGSKLYAVDFTYDGSGVTLGDSTHVEPKTTLEAVERGTPCDLKQFRAVDSSKLAEAEKTAPNNLPTKIMADATITPEIEAQVSAKLEPTLRSKIEGELQTRNSKTLEALTAHKKEIRALADDHCKTSGANWAGKPGEVFVVADKIRSLQIEAFEALDKGASPSDIRNTFKTDCGELVRSSRKPENPAEIANLPEEIASRCSLKRLWDEADKAFERGMRSAAFKLTDGAEAESEKEIRLRSQRFPGGMGVEPVGQLFPANVRCSAMTADARRAMKRNLSGRMTRDALSTDYPTMGAGIAPEYLTPIELLRNKMVFGRLGVTMISGVVGSPIVLPRQTAPGVADSLPEGATENASDMTWDQVRLTPHRISSVRKYSRFGMTQFPGFEAYAWDDGMQTIAIKADYLGLNGGANGDEPTGILNQFGIGQVVFGGSAANAYKNLIALETAIRKSNIDEEPVFVTTSVGRGTLRITPATLTGSTVVSGASTALWFDNQLVGRPAEDSQQVPNDIVVAFVPRHVLFADWLGTAVVLDTLTLADQDKYKLSLNKYIDWGLRHPSAVARSMDSIAVLS